MEGEYIGRDDWSWGVLRGDVETLCSKNSLEYRGMTLVSPSNMAYCV